MAPCAFNAQQNFDVRLGNIGRSFFGPFNEANAASGKVLIEPRIQEFVRLIEAIEIKVIQRYSRNRIRF